MSIVAIILATLIGLLVIILVFLLTQTVYFKYTVPPKINSENLPSVSLLIAMRNEENNIEDCLNSIEKLNYPKDKLEILIGDDDSEDNSYEIVANFIKKATFNIKLFKITEQENNQRGKSNVLAQLTDKATGKFYAFTDADIELPPTWLQEMVGKCSEKNTGIVSGITAVKNNSWQNIDWIFSIGMVKTISDLSVPITALGNNMIIPKAVYDEIGGFANLDFSITEDYDIFQKIIEKYGYKNLFHKEVLAYSKPVKGVLNLLMQRKRWMSGAVQLPWQIFGILGLQAIYFPLIIALFFVNREAGIFLFWTKYFFQTLYISILFVKLRLKVSFFSLLFYEVYTAIISVFLLLFYILPIKVNWKGREY